MNKSLLKELILPAFWLFFFAVSSKSDVKVNELKKEENTVTEQEISTPGASHAVNKNKVSTSTKAVFLSY